MPPVASVGSSIPPRRKGIPLLFCRKGIKGSVLFFNLSYKRLRSARLHQMVDKGFGGIRGSHNVCWEYQMINDNTVEALARIRIKLSK